jgi:hypothetical protein
MAERTSPIAIASLTAIGLSAATAFGHGGDGHDPGPTVMLIVGAPLFGFVLFFPVVFLAGLDLGLISFAVLMLALPVMGPAFLVTMAHRTERRSLAWLLSMTAGAAWYWVGTQWMSLQFPRPG